MKTKIIATILLFAFAIFQPLFAQSAKFGEGLEKNVVKSKNGDILISMKLVSPNKEENPHDFYPFTWSFIKYFEPNFDFAELLKKYKFKNENRGGAEYLDLYMQYLKKEKKVQLQQAQFNAGAIKKHLDNDFILHMWGGIPNDELELFSMRSFNRPQETVSQLKRFLSDQGNVKRRKNNEGQSTHGYFYIVGYNNDTQEFAVYFANTSYTLYWIPTKQFKEYAKIICYFKI
jgi:hypothetical protein